MVNAGKLRDKLLEADGIDPGGVSDAELARFQQSLAKHVARDYMWGGIWRVIKKSRLSEIAAVAAVIALVFVFSRGPSDKAAWADVVNAVNETDNVHIVMEMALADGQSRKYEAWLKNKVMLREETPGQLEIDNGVDRLVVDHDKRTAQHMDSYAPFDDFMDDEMFELLLLFRGEETPYDAEQLQDETSSTGLVYRVSYRGRPYGKVWVDYRTNLPLKIVSEEAPGEILKWEAVFDYATIPEETFRLDVPGGYTVLPRKECPTISGRVVDEQGMGVAGAQVYAPETRDGGWAQSGEDGHFVIKYPAFNLRLPELPMFMRALILDDPHRVAWTIIRNPEPGLTEDGDEYSHGENLGLMIRDEQALAREIPGDGGEITLRARGDVEVPFAVEGVVLKMEPAAVISGQVKDEAGDPVAHANVSCRYLECRWKDSGNRIMHLQAIGDLSGQRDPVVTTDKQGRYVLGHLPNWWSYGERLCRDRSCFVLWAEADGYATEQKNIHEGQEGDFILTKCDVVVRGTVIDNQGQPVAYRRVEIGMDDELEDEVEERDFDIEEAETDEQGRFELYVPRVKGLMLTLSLDNPYTWIYTFEDRGIIKDERDPAFVYYLEMEVPIRFVPGKNEYWVEIVPHRPDITITVEVTDTEGRPLAGIPIVPYSSRREISRWWSLFRLIGMTDENGICTIGNVPLVQELVLEFCRIPKSMVPFGYDDRVLEYFQRYVGDEYIAAFAEVEQQFKPVSKPVPLEAGKREYTLRVILARLTEAEQREAGNQVITDP